MNKLVCIVGSTGTGKTKKAIELSREKPSIIISADSRQVYRGMDIVTGKDHPKGIKIYGIDIVDPDESCSVAVWYESVMPHINKAWDEGKQVIMVGGTGLYVKALTDGIPTMQVPINQSLRDELATLSIIELQNKLRLLDPFKWNAMNNSDQNNPRRLTRAIEIAKSSHPRSTIHDQSSIIIGLRYSVESIQRNKIIERVNARIKQGAIQEIESLFKKYGGEIQSMTAIGYKSIIRFIKNQIDEDTMIESWVEGELAYAKRQMTWFRKQPVIWYDIDIYGNS